MDYPTTAELAAWLILAMCMFAGVFALLAKSSTGKAEEIRNPNAGRVYCGYGYRKVR